MPTEMSQGVTVPVLIALPFVPVDDEAAEVVSVAGTGCCAIGMLTNQIHQWAHSSSPPRSVRVLHALTMRPRLRKTVTRSA